ncbi:Nif3-like dinuclear metal center hexameric protein, partial [Fusobacterium sp.]|uniref:Nif3-like dinuclear metal center hexameric protein n=1 Tax=Fusobacterium sp. TaxID=68766 RepID=UPI0026382597
MKLSEIISRLEAKFPKQNAESWDNVGLLVGNKNNDIKKIQISLDVTSKVIDEAIKNKVDLIISHHPLIFSAIKEINTDSLIGEKILKLIENKISVYSL